MDTQMRQSRFQWRLPAPLKACLLFLMIIPLVSISSCDDQRTRTVTWTEFEPVYMPHEEFIAAAGVEDARDLEEPGKIYLYKDYLFVNELNEGVHIIDNRDPASPQMIGFINIPANKDMAVRGDRLYADSSDDLLVFDITDFHNVELISRIPKVFNMTRTAPLPFPYRQVDHSKGVVVDWKPVKVEEECQGSNCNNLGRGSGFWVETTGRPATDGSRASGDGGSGQSGTGGSMARFAIVGDFLYVVDWSQLITFDISDPEPVKHNQQNVGWMIETIFPYNDNLFIGSGNSMYIYDISNPVSPELLSRFRHATACDPVVVEGDYAYVTLRDGEVCPNVEGTNQLEVIHVKDLQNPKRIGIYEMIHPHGLGIDNGDLFISEGLHGLKVMDATDPYNLREIRHINNIRTYDVIPNNGVLIVTGGSGIIQYDYSNINNLKELSIIPVFKPQL